MTNAQRLLQLARRQVAALESDDVEECQRLQDQRDELGPAASQDLGGEEQRRVLLVLEEVAHSDARGLALLQELLVSVQTELSGLHRGRGALTGYRGGPHHRGPIALDRQA